MDQCDLSVVLVNWNALKLTSEAVSSVLHHTQGIQCEIFVVDNGTTRDGSVTELPARFPQVKFIANSANQGFSKANNQAIRQTKGRYVLLLNNDTVQTGNALVESVRYMDKNPKVGALGILHLNNDAGYTPQPSVFTFPNPWSEVRILLGFGKPVPAPITTEVPAEGDVDWICGSYLLMRRECLEQVGELDERFFIYDEDVDWCLRAHQVGWKVRFWPGVSMIHVGSAAKPFMKDKTFIHFRSHLSYYYKHHGQLAAAAYYLAMGLRLTRATAWQALQFLLGRTPFANLSERFRRQMQFLWLRSGKFGG